MNPSLILAFGMIVVIGGILWLRLHPFLALLAGAFTVAALTPQTAIIEWALAKGLGESDAAAIAGKGFAVRVAEGFGTGCMKVGIVIAMASIIGKCLLDSGGAERIVLGLRRLFGEKRTPAAFAASGFVLGIPVFFDTVFYLLLPLGKALRMKTGGNYLLYILCIVAGATMAHSLVPPTPGPFAVAEELKVDIGTMILGGCIVGMFSVTAGYLYAVWANRRWEIPLRPSVELGQAELDAMAERKESDLPRLGVSLLPVLLPVILISGKTVLRDGLGLDVPAWLITLGDKNLALAVSAILAVALLGIQKKMNIPAPSGPGPGGAWKRGCDHSGYRLGERFRECSRANRHCGDPEGYRAGIGASPASDRVRGDVTDTDCARVGYRSHDYDGGAGVADDYRYRPSLSSSLHRACDWMRIQAGHVDE